MTRSRRHTAHAFTLIEAIAAIVLLAVAVPGMFWAIQDAQTARANPGLYARARWLAGERLEGIIADRHSPTRGYAYLTSGNYPAETSVPGFPTYTRSVQITETAADLASAGSGYKRINVSVGFADGRGIGRTFTLATVVTDY